MRVIIDDDLRLEMISLDKAEELFVLTDQNRQHLRQWLPWLDYTQSSADTANFIGECLKGYEAGKQLNLLIYFQEVLVGTLGFNSINLDTKVGHVGYWLDASSGGKGIVTKAVKELEKIGFDGLGLEKIEIQCAVGNSKSRAIPERLGYKIEGTIRRAENLYGTVVDHVVYGMLKEECLRRPKLKGF